MRKKVVILFLFTGTLFAQSKYYSYTFKDSNSIKYKINKTLECMFNDSDFYHYWQENEVAKWGESLQDILYWNQHYYKNKKHNFVLNYIEKLSENRYQVVLSNNLIIDSNNSTSLSIFNLIANYDSLSDKVQFSSYLSLETSQWYTVKSKYIQFYKKNKLDFNENEAFLMNQKNESIANFFKMNPVNNIVYFSAKNLKEMFNIMGYDYIENMYYAKTGALVLKGKNDYEYIIFSGNNKEIYSHELVHFYTRKLIKNDTSSTRFADEGLATFLEGSSEKTLLEHLTILKSLIKKGMSFDLVANISDNEIKYSNEISTNLYVIGGYIAKLIYEKKGLDGLIIFLNTPNDKLKNTVCRLLEINEKQLVEKFFNDLNNLK